MKIFLTSSPGGSFKDEYGVRIPCKMDDSNQFLLKLAQYWPRKANCLVIASDPDNIIVNDTLKSVFPESFWESGLPFQNLEILDRRNEEKVDELLHDNNVIILAGGHVPTQNQFFHRIGLKEKLRIFSGILIGISAGSMNCAQTVYAQPEEPGEAVDPSYQRYLQGLGLTSVRILPHYQYLKNLELDGLRILEDICIPDSKTMDFYALVDGSYLFIDDDGSTAIYGESYLFRDGAMQMVSKKDEVKELF